ncbi:uncharacterized mitochondrial protein AtMg00810-like [Spinacia oleracea]|uniref:Uncharacterized mitochondrial protein AtMg00810-like n=1 Tax=Spinacia oleracea TaxID=3562 RepID=A0ABM3QYG3_SPIOL|nr:uncharacterized mitochondrial protein AtMg00810-like [Spinacia oleracea]
MATVRSLFAVASIENWYVQQMDVKNVFLHGNNLTEINAAKTFLSSQFHMKDMGLKLPMDSHQKLTAGVGEPLSHPEMYEQLVGKLIYLTITRPDIAYTVHVLSKFMHAPTSVHLQASKRVLGYL